MSTHEDSPSVADELAQRRERRVEGGERPLRERVRDEARRSARRHAAAARARRRTDGGDGDGGGGSAPQPPFGGGDTAGAA